MEPAGPRSPGAVWRRLKDEIARWDGSAVISHEWLTLASPAQAAEAIAQLRPAHVEVIVTARSLTALVSAAWQETVKIGRSQGLDDFVDSLDATEAADVGRAGGPQRWHWSALDPAHILSVWSRDLPVDRVHVVTVPPPGTTPDVLWSRFAAVCGIDSAGVDLDIARTNESLSSEAAALMLRVGPRLREAVESTPPHHWSEQYKWVRDLVGHQILVPQPGSRIRLRDEQVARLHERSLRARRALDQAGYPVAGTLDDLTAPPPAGGRHPDDVSPEEVNALAVTVITELFGRLRAASRADEP
jgi:hypothetical protein